MFRGQCVILFVTIIAWLCTQVETNCKNLISYLGAFDDIQVSDYGISSMNLGDLAMCYRKCDMEARCVSYQYNKRTKSCSLFAVGFNSPSGTLKTTSSNSGAQLFLMNGRLGAFGMSCSSHSDCKFTLAQCESNTCRCGLAYSYDPQRKECRTHCNRYGDTLSYFRDWGLNGCNTRGMWASSAAFCRDACKNEAGFTCINSEYDRGTGTCHLCNTAWFGMPGGNRVHSPGWDFFHRNCAL